MNTEQPKLTAAELYQAAIQLGIKPEEMLAISSIPTLRVQLQETNEFDEVRNIYNMSPDGSTLKHEAHTKLVEMFRGILAGAKTPEEVKKLQGQKLPQLDKLVHNRMNEVILDLLPSASTTDEVWSLERFAPTDSDAEQSCRAKLSLLYRIEIKRAVEDGNSKHLKDMTDSLWSDELPEVARDACRAWLKMSPELNEMSSMKDKFTRRRDPQDQKICEEIDEVWDRIAETALESCFTIEACTSLIRCSRSGSKAYTKAYEIKLGLTTVEIGEMDDVKAILAYLPDYRDDVIKAAKGFRINRLTLAWLKEQDRSEDELLQRLPHVPNTSQSQTEIVKALMSIVGDDLEKILIIRKHASHKLVLEKIYGLVEHEAQQSVDPERLEVLARQMQFTNPALAEYCQQKKVEVLLTQVKGASVEELKMLIKHKIPLIQEACVTRALELKYSEQTAAV